MEHEMSFEVNPENSYAANTKQSLIITFIHQSRLMLRTPGPTKHVVNSLDLCRKTYHVILLLALVPPAPPARLSDADVDDTSSFPAAMAQAAPGISKNSNHNPYGSKPT